MWVERRDWSRKGRRTDPTANFLYPSDAQSRSTPRRNAVKTLHRSIVITTRRRDDVFAPNYLDDLAEQMKSDFSQSFTGTFAVSQGHKISRKSRIQLDHQLTKLLTVHAIRYSPSLQRRNTIKNSTKIGLRIRLVCSISLTIGIEYIVPCWI